MGRMPDAWLVIEDVIAQAAARVRAPLADQVLHPSLLKRRARRNVGVVWIISDDVLSASPNPVSRVRAPLPIVSGLWAVFGDRKAGQLASVTAEFRHPIEQRAGKHCFCVGCFRLRDESVAALTGHRARVADALEVPILRAIIAILQPVISARVVAAVAIQRNV